MCAAQAQNQYSVTGLGLNRSGTITYVEDACYLKQYSLSNGLTQCEVCTQYYNVINGQRRCVDVCAGQLREGQMCRTACSAPYLQNLTQKSCVARCRDEQFFDEVAKTCSDACAGTCMYYEAANQICAADCGTDRRYLDMCTQYIDENACTTTCASVKFYAVDAGELVCKKNSSYAFESGLLSPLCPADFSVRESADMN